MIEVLKIQKNLGIFLPVRIEMKCFDDDCTDMHFLHFEIGYHALLEAIANKKTEKIIQYLNTSIGINTDKLAVKFSFDYDGTPLVKVENIGRIKSAMEYSKKVKEGQLLIKENIDYSYENI